MLALDTNVIVRYLTNDDAGQARTARRLVDENEIRVLHSVLLETEWVLRSLYRFDSERIRKALIAFLGLDNVAVEQPARVALALGWFERGLDFADALHLAGAEDCAGFATFDRKFAAAARKLKAGKPKAL